MLTVASDGSPTLYPAPPASVRVTFTRLSSISSVNSSSRSVTVVAPAGKSTSATVRVSITSPCARTCTTTGKAADGALAAVIVYVTSSPSVAVADDTAMVSVGAVLAVPLPAVRLRLHRHGKKHAQQRRKHEPKTGPASQPALPLLITL